MWRKIFHRGKNIFGSMDWCYKKKLHITSFHTPSHFIFFLLFSFFIEKIFSLIRKLKKRFLKIIRKETKRKKWDLSVCDRQIVHLIYIYIYIYIYINYANNIL